MRPRLDEGEPAVFLVPDVDAGVPRETCRDAECDRKRSVRDLSGPRKLENSVAIVRITCLSSDDDVTCSWRAGLHAVQIIDALRQVVDERTCLLIDGGSIGQWAHHLLCDRYPGRWLTCGRSGVVGWGVGGAMGARLACPDAAVILLSGDGAFTFNVADLESAVRQQLGFVAIVADDQGWGITRTGHMKQFGEAIASALGPVAFNRLAEALGARGVAVTRPGELGPALRRALAEPGVTVIHVPIVGGNPA